MMDTLNWLSFYTVEAESLKERDWEQPNIGLHCEIKTKSKNDIDTWEASLRLQVSYSMNSL